MAIGNNQWENITPPQPSTSLTYNDQACKYSIDKLSDYVYLINAEGVKNIHIDNGYAYVDGITQTPLILKGYNLNLEEEETLDGRYAFNHSLKFSLKGYANHKNFNGRFFVLVKDMEGTLWILNPMLPCKVSYTYTLNSNSSHTDFTLSTVSNHPILRVFEKIDGEQYQCDGYEVEGFSSLKLNISKFSKKNGEYVIYTNDGFKTIKFAKDSAVLTETFDGETLQHTITFNIGFDDYKSSWQYNLLEFPNNRYAAIVKTKYGQYISCGFGYGLQPSYTVYGTSEDGYNKIEITLNDVHDIGNVLQYNNELFINDSSRTNFVYTTEHGGYECVGENKARYLLQKEIDELGNPLNNYKCLDGYEDRFPYLNIVGTFEETETFASSLCSSQECALKTSLPNDLVFYSKDCQTYYIQSDSDWSIASNDDNVTVTPSQGSANQRYSITVCNNVEPTNDGTEARLTLSYCDKTKPYNVYITKTNTSCFPKGNTVTIGANGQNVMIPSNCCISRITDESGLINNIQIKNGSITMYVPQNLSGGERRFELEAIMCDGSVNTIIIIQNLRFERWVAESTTCIDGSKCILERLYTGSTSSQINTPTSELRTVNCTVSEECATILTRWVDTENTMCFNGKKYIIQIEEKSSDNGISYRPTGLQRQGSEVEDTNGECAYGEYEEEWRTSDGYICDDTTKFERQELYRRESGGYWYPSGVYRKSDVVIETNSSDCGYIVPSAEWRYEKWEAVSYDYVCDDGNKYEKLQRYVSNDNVASIENVSNWYPTDVYKKGDLLEENSTDCGYDPSIVGNCSEYREDGNTICNGFNLYKYVRKYVRECDDCNNCSSEWKATNIHKIGELVKENSLDCGYIPREVYTRWTKIGTICDGFNKYEQFKKYISEDNENWYETNILKLGYTAIESNSSDCGYIPTVEFDYQWVVSTMTQCVGYNKYYLYKKQRKRRDGNYSWQDVVPTETSINGDGSQSMVLAEENSTDCGYVAPSEPIYEWRQVETAQNNYYCWWCNPNNVVQEWDFYRYYCEGGNKYVQCYLYESDDGVWWYEPENGEEFQDHLVERDSTDCLGHYKLIRYGTRFGKRIGYCDSSQGTDKNKITSGDVKGNDEAYISNITAVTIGDCAEYIASYAFTDSNVSSLTIPSNIIGIYRFAFFHAKLREVKFESETPPEIGGTTSDVFEDMQTTLTTIYIPRGTWQAYSAVDGLAIHKNIMVEYDKDEEESDEYCLSLNE